MAEAICNTSPLQYQHQLGLLHLLPDLLGRIIVPAAVADELAVGRMLGVNLPDVATLEWVIIRSPINLPSVPILHDLGAGESAVLALALEIGDSPVILDDQLGRQAAAELNLKLRGTLGILLDAKRKGIIPAVAPVLDQLDQLRFRVAPYTRRAVLVQAGELQ